MWSCVGAGRSSECHDEKTGELDDGREGARDYRAPGLAALGNGLVEATQRPSPTGGGQPC